MRHCVRTKSESATCSRVPARFEETSWNQRLSVIYQDDTLFIGVVQRGPKLECFVAAHEEASARGAIGGTEIDLDLASR